MHAMITLSSADSQIVLFAKGHLVSWDASPTGILRQIRWLLAERAGVSEQAIGERAIVLVLTDLLCKLNLLSKNPSKFIENIIFGNLWAKSDQNANTLANFVYAALVEMQNMPVLDKDGNALVHIEPVDSKYQEILSEWRTI